MKTLAAVLVETNQPLRIIELSLPPLKPGQVIVDLHYSGVCRSQLLEARGLRGPDRFLPHALGHEGSGIVLETGEGVTKVKPGDHVVVSWIKGCGLDVPSTVYQSDIGPINSGAVSTFMKQTITCENRVTPIVKEMPLREAALLGCAVPTGAGIIMNLCSITPESSVAVFGLGGVGMSAVLAARSMKASKIIGIDILDSKLSLAQQVGVNHPINASTEDPLGKIHKFTDGLGVDYAIEAAGLRQTMEVAFRSVRNNGGLCILAGNLEHGGSISVDPFDLIRGKRIIGTWGGETVPDRDIPRYIEAFQNSDMHFQPLLSKEYSLDQINESLWDLENGRLTARALIDMSK